MATVRDINGSPVADEYGSSTALGANGVFTSATIPSRNAGGPVRRYVGFVYASHAGSLQHQISVNGTTWVNNGSATSVSATTLVTFDQVVYAPFVRVVYTNGGTAQTSFNLALSPRNI